MRLKAVLALTVVAMAGPAAAGDIEIYQTGQSNWTAVNQYNRVNNAIIYQNNINTNGNNYAAAIQQGRVNKVVSEQYAKTDNALVVEQAGRITYVSAFQQADGTNRFSATQTRLRRR